MKKNILAQVIVSLVLIFSSFTYAGGGSDGGGNTYRGRPLESYAKNPIELEAFKSFIVPVFKALESKQAPENHLDILKNLMLSVYSQKIWYFVPGPLEQVPAELLNSAIRTDQAALQGFDRVWIDENIWNTMTAEDQARLLLHETFMGLKIFKFASSYRLCNAAYPKGTSCSDNDHMDLTILLDAHDYVDVQKMTIQTSSQYLQMNASDWVKMLNENNVKFSYDWFDAVTIISPTELGSLLKKSSVTGFMPTIGYDLRSFDTGSAEFSNQQEMYEYLQAHKKSCNISASVTGQRLNLKLRSGSEKFEGTISLPSHIETRYDDVFHENKKLKSIGISYPTGQARPNGGFTMYNIWLSFDFFKLSHVYIQEMVCDDKKCTGPEYDVKGGMLFICSDNQSLFKP